jgi:NADH:ubiquinone oxidoreductase subunit F (NADH-binding)
LEPANRYIKLKKISLVPEMEKKCECLTTDDNFSIKVDFQCINDDAMVGLTLVVYTETGECVFSSINNQIKFYEDHK